MLLPLRLLSVKASAVNSWMLYVLMLFFEAGVQTNILSFSINWYLPCTVTLLPTVHSYRILFLKVQLIERSNDCNAAVFAESSAEINLVLGGTILSTCTHSHFLVSNCTVLFLHEQKQSSAITQIQKNRVFVIDV